MLLNTKHSTIQQVHFSEIETSNVLLFIKREDTLHPFISGNKYRKLKYNLIEAQKLGYKKLITFGGAFSNHIAATAAAGAEFNFETIGVIRGDEFSKNPSHYININPTLTFASAQGMKFYFISRSQYKEKTSEQFLSSLKNKFGDFYLVPEGGTNALAVKGCEEILTDDDYQYNIICTAVGTGGTISGIINTSKQYQKVIGFPALKGNFLQHEIQKFILNKDNWQLNTMYHFGGYAKISKELITFINKFKYETGIALDPIYTGKMLYGIVDLIKKEYFKKGTKILAIHTGGLQGIEGMNVYLKNKKLPLIN